jgi:hypothetical protein
MSGFNPSLSGTDSQTGFALLQIVRKLMEMGRFRLCRETIAEGGKGILSLCVCVAVKRGRSMSKSESNQRRGKGIDKREPVTPVG